MIDSFTFGRFVINGQVYSSNVIVLGDRVLKARYLSEHKLVLDDFKDIVLYHPEYVIIGTGASGVVKPSQDILDFLKKKGFKVLVLRTGDACLKFNSLVSVGHRTAAFLHNTC